jgi:cytochrome c oxidase subunit III
MTEDPFDNSPAAPPRVWNDKGDIHVPGAGSMGMALLIAALSMIFGATFILFLLFRFARLAGEWKASAVPLPATLWLSTALIVVSSYTMYAAYRAIKSDREKFLTRYLAVTLALGFAFLFLQCINWFDVYAQLAAKDAPHNFSIAFFYILTIVHAAHVLGGLIPMTVTLVKARRGVYSRNFHPGVRYSNAYWHFLTLMWLILFGMIYFT